MILSRWRNPRSYTTQSLAAVLATSLSNLLRRIL
jgi:hypothetical protein